MAISETRWLVSVCVSISVKGKDVWRLRDGFLTRLFTKRGSMKWLTFFSLQSCTFMVTGAGSSTLNFTTTTTVLRPFFRDHPGEPVPEENFLTLWCKGRLTEADTPTIRLGATPSGLTSAHLHHPAIFYRPGALPAAQPTVSKQFYEKFIKNVPIFKSWNGTTKIFRKEFLTLIVNQCSQF